MSVRHDRRVLATEPPAAQRSASKAEPPYGAHDLAPPTSRNFIESHSYGLNERFWRIAVERAALEVIYRYIEWLRTDLVPQHGPARERDITRRTSERSENARDTILLGLREDADKLADQRRIAC